jgi:SAM-dependent methyltransferase
MGERGQGPRDRHTGPDVISQAPPEPRRPGPDIAALELQARGENLAAMATAMPLRGATRLLDVGCGTCAFTRVVAASGDSQAIITGLDVSLEHLSYAANALRRHRITNIRLIAGDFLDDQTLRDLGTGYDLVFCRYVLMYMLPRGLGQTFVSRMIHLARPGGYVVCIEPDVNFGFDRYPDPPEPLASVLRDLASCHRALGLVEWRTGVRLFGELRAAGLSDVQVSLVDGRVIQGGRPEALAEHAGLGVEELLEPCVRDVQITSLGEVATQWRAYVSSPDSFLYHPIFMAVGRVP